MQGHTVLYIPNEGLGIPAEKAAKDKDLVQRLEKEYVSYSRGSGRVGIGHRRREVLLAHITTYKSQAANKIPAEKASEDTIERCQGIQDL